MLGAVSGFLSLTDSNAPLTPGDPVAVPATLSFSGALMSFIYFNDFPTDGFLLDTSGVTFGVPAYSAGPSFGGTTENFDPANWSLTAKNVQTGVVPVPAALPLLAAGIAGLGLAGGGGADRSGTPGDVQRRRAVIR